MSKFYGQVEGMSSTNATRRGSQFIKTSAQSYDGSVITKLYYNDKGELMVRIQTDEMSSPYGDTMFDDTFTVFKQMLKEWGEE